MTNASSSSPVQPLKPLDSDGFAICMDAIVIWEHLVLNPHDRPWTRMWNDCGTMAMRELVIDLAYHSEALWRSLPWEEQDSAPTWDWEWIPAWLELCVDWSGDVPVPITGAKP